MPEQPTILDTMRLVFGAGQSVVNKPAPLRPNAREPHPKQLPFILSTAKRKVIRAGRRGGKTVGVATLAVKAFVAGHRVLYATPTGDQIARFWYEVKRALQTDIDAKVLKLNETEHYIERARTENRIRAKTAWNADTLRGDFADLLILDEYQLMNEDAWKVVGAPMLLDNNGDAVFVYTPPSIRVAGVMKAHDPMHAVKMYKMAAQREAFVRSGFAGTLNNKVVDIREYPDAVPIPYDRPRWQTFHFSSLDNPHLDAEALSEITQDITHRVYEAEILAIDQDDNPLALWNRGMIDPHRVTQIPELERIVVGVDPSASTEGAEAGIVAAGVGVCRCKGYPEHHAFVLDDATVQGSPEQWASAAVTLYNKLRADRMVAEQNNGGEMVRLTISTIEGAPPVRLVVASRGKITRAEPIAAFYEQGKVHHFGTFAELEDQMCGFDNMGGQESPDRYDALVWAMTVLVPQLRAGRIPPTEIEQVAARLEEAFPVAERPGENSIAWDQSKAYYARQWAAETGKPALYGEGMDFYEEERANRDKAW